MNRLILPLLLFVSVSLAAATDENTKIRNYRERNEHAIIQQFVGLLSIPNVTSEDGDIRRNAMLIAGMMRARGLEPRLLEIDDPSAPPVVFGEWKVPGARRTLIFYAHYDGQPADPKQWTGSQPWTPLLRSAAPGDGGRPLPMPAKDEPIDPEWRLYARSASDDKAGVMAILTAVDALRATGLRPASNLKFFFEGEEERGSPHLGQIVSKHRELLASDCWIIVDGPVHQTARKQVVFGVRGDVNVDLTVYGARRPLHSGHYGNWAPNPALLLAQLLSSMKDSSGRVTIDGWYDDVEPLGAGELQAIAAAPEVESQLQAELGLARTEGQGKTLAELINLPSLNINGFASGDVGSLARNVIPTTASAVLDLRLVKGNDHRRQVEKLTAHVRKQGYYVLDREPTGEERRQHPRIATLRVRTGGYNAARTPMDLPISRSIVMAVQSVSSEPVIITPTLGGSLPLSILGETIGATTITVPLANYDNNQHAENENIRIQNLWDGIEIMAALMSMR